METAGQILGLFASGVMFVAYQQRTQKKIMLWQIFAISMFTVHFFMLGAYTGAVMNVLGVGRAALYYNLDKKWAQVRAWKYILALVFLAAGIITWESIFSLFPLISMVLSTFVFAIQDSALLRKLTIPCSALWLVYNVKVVSYAGVITESFAIVSLIIAIIRYDIKKIPPKNKE